MGRSKDGSSNLFALSSSELSPDVKLGDVSATKLIGRLCRDPAVLSDSPQNG